VLSLIAEDNGGNTLVERRSGERHSVDWTFLCKNNWKKMMEKRSKRLKIA
jgi:hypothetical protein